MVRPRSTSNSSYAQLPNFRRAVLRFFYAFKARQSEQQLVVVDDVTDASRAPVSLHPASTSRSNARLSVDNLRHLPYKEDVLRNQQTFKSSSLEGQGQGDYSSHRHLQKVTSEPVKVADTLDPGQGRSIYSSNSAWEGDGWGDGQHHLSTNLPVPNHRSRHAPADSANALHGELHANVSPSFQRNVKVCRSKHGEQRDNCSHHVQMYENNAEQTLPKQYDGDVLPKERRNSRRLKPMQTCKTTSVSGLRHQLRHQDSVTDRPVVVRRPVSRLSSGECGDVHLMEVRQKETNRQAFRRRNSTCDSHSQLHQFDNGSESDYRPAYEDGFESPRRSARQRRSRRRDQRAENISGMQHSTDRRQQIDSRTAMYCTGDAGSYSEALINMNSLRRSRLRMMQSPPYRGHNNRNTRHQDDERHYLDASLTVQRRPVDKREVSRDWCRNKGDGDIIHQLNKNSRHRRCVRHSNARNRQHSPSSNRCQPRSPWRDTREKVKVRRKGRRRQVAGDNSDYQYQGQGLGRLRQRQMQTSKRPSRHWPPFIHEESSCSGDYRYARVTRSPRRGTTSRLPMQRGWSDSESYDSSQSSSPELLCHQPHVDERWGVKLDKDQNRMSPNNDQGHVLPNKDQGVSVLVSPSDSPQSHQSPEQQTSPDAQQHPEEPLCQQTECQTTQLSTSPTEQSEDLHVSDLKDESIMKYLESLKMLIAVLMAERDDHLGQMEEREACVSEKTEVVRAASDGLKHTRLRFEQRGLGPCPSGFVAFVRACVCTSGLPLWSLTREAMRYKESLHRIRHEQRQSYRKLAEDLRHRDDDLHDTLFITHPQVAELSDKVRLLLAEKCQLRKNYMSSVIESQRCLTEARLQYECQLYCCCHVFQSCLGPVERLTDAKQRYYYNLLDEYRRAVDVNNDSLAMIERIDLLSTAEALKTDCLCDEMRRRHIEPADSSSSSSSSNATSCSGSTVDDFTSFLTERQPSLLNDMYF